MKREYVLLAVLGLVVVVNSVILAGVAWNRSGEPGTSVVLTERELVLPYSRSSASEENSGMALRLRHSRNARLLEWFDKEKLQTLGFESREFQARGEKSYKRPQTRRAYVVLEYDGRTWAQALAESEGELAKLESEPQADERSVREQERARQRLEQMQTADSRLVPVDADRDAVRLRSRYPDTETHIIVAGRVGMRRNDDGVQGYIRSLFPRSVHVPIRFHQELEAVAAGGNSSGIHPPRYQVTLHFGRRHEPWIGAIAPLFPESEG